MMQVSVPKGWASAKLRDIAELERDSIQPADISTGTTYVGLEHIVGDGTFLNVASVDEGELASSKFSFSPDHLLYGKLRPYLRKIIRPDFHGVCSTDILPIKPSARINKDFLFHYLRQPSMVELATNRCSGANLPRLSPQTLLDFPVIFPRLPEQKRIAAILDKADSIQRKRQEAVRLTEDLLRSVFLEMFGNPVTNPKGWETKSLSEEIEFLTSGSRGWAEFYSDSGQKFIRIQNVRNGLLNFNEVQYVNPPDNREAARTKVRENDLLISITADLGRTAVVEYCN
jgi:type I restriction enzyme S subunit